MSIKIFLTFSDVYYCCGFFDLKMFVPSRKKARFMLNIQTFVVCIRK